MELWELEILSGLRRAGGTLTVGELLDVAQLISGAITNRIARLERDVDPDDRRQVLVTLTPSGLERQQQAVEANNVAEQEIFATIGPALQQRLCAATYANYYSPSKDQTPAPESCRSVPGAFPYLPGSSATTNVCGPRWFSSSEGSRRSPRTSPVDRRHLGGHSTPTGWHRSGRANGHGGFSSATPDRRARHPGPPE
jgi:DNA-binding MarR family transcriptional regulator